MRVLRNTATGVALALSAAALFAATPAAATGPVTYIDFVGACTDCVGSGVGVLTLQNFQLGSALSAANFVDFTYHSSILNFDITSANLGSFSATFDALPGSARVDIDQAPPSSGFFYELHTYLTQQGVDPQFPDNPHYDWFVGGGLVLENPGGEQKPIVEGGGGNLDFGPTYTWSQANNADLPTPPGGDPVPEPAAWTLIIAGFGLAGARLRIGRRDAGKVIA